MLIEVGNIVEGKVSGITAFGAFVQLSEGKTGLVHISEVAVEYVKNIKEYLKINQVVKVKVLSVDAEGKISLSIKKAIEQEKQKVRKASKPVEIDWSKSENAKGLSFEDKMSQFKQDSDERMQDIKRNIESKRGGGYRKSVNIY